MRLTWPVPPDYIKRNLRSVDLVASVVKVRSVNHKTGRITFHVELHNKYSIIPPDELKERLTACLQDGKPDRVIERRALYRKRHVSLQFTLDCSAWSIVN